MSRKLDALVAEKVMGWPPWKEHRGDYTYVVFSKTGDEPWKARKSSTWETEKKRYERITASEIDHHNMILCLDHFRPSTDPAAMMLVLGKIGDWPATKAERVPLWTVTDTKDKDTWVWRVRLMMNGGLMWTAHHETLPTAVCLAALRWKGVSEDEIQEALR